MLEPITAEYVQNDTTNNQFQFSPFTCEHEQCCNDVTYTYSAAEVLEDPPAFGEDYISVPSFDGSKYVSIVDTTRLSQNSFWIHAQNNYDGSVALSPKITLNVVNPIPEPDTTVATITLYASVVLAAVIAIGVGVIAYKKYCAVRHDLARTTPAENLGDQPQDGSKLGAGPDLEAIIVLDESKTPFGHQAFDTIKARQETDDDGGAGL